MTTIQEDQVEVNGEATPIPLAFTPTFVASTPGQGGEQPLSFIRLSYVIHGRLISFQEVVTSPDDVQRVVEKLVQEARRAN